jgi:ferredoxin
MTRITVEGEDVAIDCGPEETILEALHRTHHAVRVGCRRGGCGVCKVDIVNGEVAYTRPVADKVLTDQDKADGICLTCRAVPTTDLHVRMREDDLKRAASLLSFYANLLQTKEAASA